MCTFTKYFSAVKIILRRTPPASLLIRMYYMLDQQSIEIDILREINFSNTESIKIATFLSNFIASRYFCQDYRVPRGSNPRP